MGRRKKSTSGPKKRRPVVAIIDDEEDRYSVGSEEVDVYSTPEDGKDVDESCGNDSGTDNMRTPHKDGAKSSADTKDCPASVFTQPLDTTLSPMSHDLETTQHSPTKAGGGSASSNTDQRAVQNGNEKESVAPEARRPPIEHNAVAAESSSSNKNTDVSSGIQIGSLIQGMETATQVARDANVHTANATAESSSNEILSGSSQMSENSVNGSGFTSQGGTQTQTQSDVAGTKKRRSRLKLQRGNPTTKSLSASSNAEQDEKEEQSSDCDVGYSSTVDRATFLGANSTNTAASSSDCPEETIIHDVPSNEREEDVSRSSSSQGSGADAAGTNTASNDRVDLTSNIAPKQTPVKRKRGRVAHETDAENSTMSSAAKMPRPPPQCRPSENDPLPSQGSSTSQGSSKSAEKLASNNSSSACVAPSSAARDSKSTKLSSTAQKTKKRTFQDQVLHHMLISCKPFNTKTLAQATQSTDAAVHSVMLSLVDKGVVSKKEFLSGKARGNTKVLYWANQESTCKEAMDAKASPEEIQLAQNEFATLKKQEALIGNEMALVIQEPANGELDCRARQMEEEIIALQKRIEDTKTRIKADREKQSSSSSSRLSGAIKKSAKQVERERCPRRLKMRINAMRNEWKERKEKCMDFVDQLADAMEKKLKDAVKVVDIETDEMVGVKMPPKRNID